MRSNNSVNGRKSRYTIFAPVTSSVRGHGGNLVLDKTFSDRFSRLQDVRIAEQAKQFKSELMRLDRQAASKGMFSSGHHASQIRQAHERELEVRTIITWGSIVRAHKTLGIELGSEAAAELKSLLHNEIRKFSGELSSSLQSYQKRLPVQVPMSLNEATAHVTDKHDIEVDLYVDSLKSESTSAQPERQQYNFYGAVGTVQTGASAQANVVQNIGASDQEALLKALELTDTAVRSATHVSERQQSELLDIIVECKAELASNTPNNTKLLPLFGVLATSVQAIASARPAYQALKAALLPLGVTLP